MDLIEGHPALHFSLLRSCCFIDDTLVPQVGRYVRRVGRPRQDWLSEVMKAGAHKLGGAARLDTLLRMRSKDAEAAWLRELR